MKSLGDAMGLEDKRNQTFNAQWQEDNRTRAAIYNLFATALARKIDQSWLSSDFQNTLTGGLPDGAGKELMIKALDKAQNNQEYFGEIQLDFDALFIVPGPKLIFPYESCYSCRNIDGTFGRLWQEPAQEMYRILQEWELKFAEGWDLIPDHIAVELFFMAHLCHKATESNLMQDEIFMLEEWQQNFFKTHLVNWAFDLIRNFQHKAGTDFYVGLVTLLAFFLEEEWRMLKNPDDDIIR